MAPNARVRYFVVLVNSKASQTAVTRATRTNSMKTHAELKPKTEAEAELQMERPSLPHNSPLPLHIPAHERHSSLLIFLPLHPSIFPSGPPTLIPLPPFLSATRNERTFTPPRFYLSRSLTSLHRWCSTQWCSPSLCLPHFLSVFLSKPRFVKAARYEENRDFAYLRARATNERKVDEIIFRFTEKLDDFHIVKRIMFLVTQKRIG